MYFPYKSLKYLTLLGKWWCMPLIPELKRQKQAIWVQGQPGPHSKFQVSRATQRNPISIERKSRIWETLWGEKKIFKKALCCFLVFPTTTIWLYCWVISPDPPKKVTFLIKKLFIHLFTYFWGSISVFLALLDWEIWLLLSHSWNVSPYLVLKKLLNFKLIPIFVVVWVSLHWTSHFWAYTTY